MMYNDDIELIERVLSGDESAFASLVKKYHKAVHTLAWRIIGDFHIAEEITQDAFLKVYQKLHTLKNPNHFLGWIYVITTNLSNSWLRKKRLPTYTVEDTDTTMIQRDAYSQHVAEERAKTEIEAKRAVVKKLLAKLKDSERTVMTLHYIGEMKIEEISKFLGVSVGTIKSRLQRARNRLQKEETMIREALDYFKISPNLTDNIMEKVSRLKPANSVPKPILPWTAFGTATVLVMLFLGAANQYIVQFQKPYNVNATSEPTIEIIDIPIKLDMIPNTKSQDYIAKGVINSKNTGIESYISTDKPDEGLDYEMILAGIKYNDEIVKSGDAKVAYSLEQPAFPVGHRDRSWTLSGTIIFDSDNIRWDSLSKTIILMPNSSWQVIRYRKRKPLYFFAPQKSELPNELIDPRNWYSVSIFQDLPTYLRNENFHIQKTEILKDDQRKNVFCYVLEKKYIEIENKQDDTFTRIWISPERGFRYLKYEVQAPTKVDINDGKIKKGTFMNTHITISHQQFGEIWFPKKGVINTSRIDSDGKKHTLIRQTIETKNCKLNISIPEEIFTMDIPDGVEIRVNNRNLSKSEFLRQYGQK